MRKFLSFALLLIFVVSLSAPFAAASSGFAEYPLVSYPSQMFDSSVLCPCVLSDKNYDLLSSSVMFGDLVKSMTKGNIYLFKYDENKKLTASLLVEGNYSCYYNHNQFVYAVNNGKDIWRYDITTGEGSLIVSAEKDIDLIYGFDDLIFWSSGSSVYLFGITEGKTKEIYKNADMTSFYPVTNRVIHVTIPDPFYTECIAHGFTDAASYYDWFVSNKEAGPQPFSRDEAIEYLSSRTLEEFLVGFEEVSPISFLYFDFIGNSVSDTFSYSPECLAVYNDFCSEVDSFGKSLEDGDSNYTIHSEWTASYDTPPQTSDSSVVFFVLAAFSAVCGFAVIAHKKSASVR